MSKREMWIAAGVVFGFASGQSPLTIPDALVLLGRWVYLDAKARRISNPVVWTIMVPVTWLFMLPVYLATRPLAAGEIRTGGTSWNILRAFAGRTPSDSRRRPSQCLPWRRSGLVGFSGGLRQKSGPPARLRGRTPLTVDGSRREIFGDLVQGVVEPAHAADEILHQV